MIINEICETCEGTGRIIGPIAFVLENGIGDIASVSMGCPDCNGKGYINIEDEEKEDKLQ